jgi:hypothetical protein
MLKGKILSTNTTYFHEENSFVITALTDEGIFVKPFWWAGEAELREGPWFEIDTRREG